MCVYDCYRHTRYIFGYLRVSVSVYVSVAVSVSVFVCLCVCVDVCLSVSVFVVAVSVSVPVSVSVLALECPRLWTDILFLRLGASNAYPNTSSPVECHLFYWQKSLEIIMLSKSLFPEFGTLPSSRTPRVSFVVSHVGIPGTILESENIKAYSRWSFREC